MIATHSSLAEEQVVSIPASNQVLQGILGIPPDPRGVVAFAHGSGSGRMSPRNLYVSRVLQEAGLGTLLFDLLTEEEATDRANVFDIDLLAERLHCGAVWLKDEPHLRGLNLGYFGASTGAAAALVAAARYADGARAVVSRGGRPDLAGRILPEIKAATLLIVGGADGVVVDLNKDASRQLRGTKELIIIPGATHLFPEPGALEEVARLAQHWFLRHLR